MSLHDLTSTYMEGAAEKNPMMRRGYSRDHRPDCQQMVIALIVIRTDSEGRLDGSAAGSRGALPALEDTEVRARELETAAN